MMNELCNTEAIKSIIAKEASTVEKYREIATAKINEYMVYGDKAASLHNIVNKMRWFYDPNTGYFKASIAVDFSDDKDYLTKNCISGFHLTNHDFCDIDGLTCDIHRIDAFRISIDFFVDKSRSIGLKNQGKTVAEKFKNRTCNSKLAQMLIKDKAKYETEARKAVINAFGDFDKFVEEAIEDGKAVSNYPSRTIAIDCTELLKELVFVGDDTCKIGDYYLCRMGFLYLLQPVKFQRFSLSYDEYTKRIIMKTRVKKSDSYYGAAFHNDILEHYSLDIIQRNVENFATIEELRAIKNGSFITDLLWKAKYDHAKDTYRITSSPYVFNNDEKNMEKHAKCLEALIGASGSKTIVYKDPNKYLPTKSVRFFYTMTPEEYNKYKEM